MARGGAIGEQFEMIMTIIWLIIIGAIGVSIYLLMTNKKRQQHIKKSIKERF
jgi:hypothetical protein